MPPVLFDPVLGTIQEFIDWSLTIVSLMIIWYVVKFFLVAPPTDEEKDAAEKERVEKGAKMREVIGDKLGEREKKAGEKKKKEKDAVKETEEKQKKEVKKRKASPAVESFREAIQASDKLLRTLGKGNNKKADRDIKELLSKVTESWKHLEAMSTNYEGKDHDSLMDVIKDLRATHVTFTKNLKVTLKQKKLTGLSEEEWDAAERGALDAVQKLSEGLGAAWKKLEKIYE